MGDFYEMFYEDALTAVARARADADLTREGRARARRFRCAACPITPLRRYLARLVAEGLPRRHLRSGRGSAQGQGPRPPRGHARRLARHVHGCRLPRRARAGVPRGRCAPAGAAGRAWGLAFLDVSTGEFAAAEFRRRRTAATAARRRAGRAAPARDRSRAETAPTIDAGGCTRSASPRAHARRRLDVRTRPRARDARRAAAHDVARRASASRRAPAAVSAAGALVTYLRDTQRGDLAHVRDISLRVAADALLIDPGHAAASRTSSRAPRAAAPARCSTTIDRTVTPMGGRLLRAWLLRPLVSLARIQDRLDAVEDFAFRTTERGKLRDAAQGHARPRAADRARLARHGRPARSGRARRSRCALLPRLRTVRRGLPGAARPQPRRRARRPRGRARRDRAHARRRAAGASRATAASSATASTPSSTSCAASAAAARRRSPRMEDAERARTGIGSLKIRYNRVFGYYIEVSKSNLGAVPGRLHPQADHRRRRALHHAGAQGVRGQGSRRRRADPRARDRAVRGAARRRRRRGAARSRTPRARVAALDVLARSPRPRPLDNYTKPHVHDGDEFHARRRAPPVVERHVDRRVRAERHAPERHRSPARHPHRARTWAASPRTCARWRCSCLLAQAGSFVPARSAKLADRRSHLRARRRVRQHRARPVDVHGGDAGDGEHPARGDVAAASSSSTRSAAARPRSTA